MARGPPINCYTDLLRTNQDLAAVIWASAPSLATWASARMASSRISTSCRLTLRIFVETGTTCRYGLPCKVQGQCPNVSVSPEVGHKRPCHPLVPESCQWHVHRLWPPRGAKPPDSTMKQRQEPQLKHWNPEAVRLDLSNVRTP